MEKEPKEELIETNDEKVVEEVQEEQSNDESIVESNNSEENIIEKVETQNDDIDEDKEPTKEFDIVTATSKVTEEKNENKVDKKKLFIIIGSALLVLIVAIVVVLLLLKDDDNNKVLEPSKPEEPIVSAPSDEECQKLIKEYGNKLALLVRDYIAEGYDVSSIKAETMTTLLDGYVVKCETFELNNNGNIKLNNCSINGSKSIYNYEKTYSASRPDTDYQVASVDGKLTFYYDGWYITEEDDEYSTEYTIKCEEDSCILDKVYAYYAIVKEKSGKVIVYNFYNNKKIYTALPGYEVNIMGKYDDDYVEDAFALTIRNSEKQEALYSLAKQDIVFDYGIYTYDWEAEGICFDDCSTVVVEDYIKIYSGNKIGLLSSKDFTVVLEPTDYDDITVDREYAYVKKGNYVGLLKYEKGEIKTLVKPNKYQTVIFNEDHIIIKKSGKYGALDISGEKQYLNGKFYDAVVVANYPNGGALVLDGKTLKVLDLDGKLIKNLGEIPVGAKLYDDYETYGSGSYNDEDYGINVWLKFTNPSYDENANDEYYNCSDSCDLELDDEAYTACQDSCEQYYNSDASHDCMEFNYNFTKGELEKYPMECEGGYAKPVLYLYPTLPTFVTVTFANPEKLTTTYPKYENSWKVLASPNGDLYDLKNNYYYALYWEEDSNHKVDFKEGFYVTKENAIEFLEEKLDKIGFTARERNEFIMYWLPILEKNEKSLVYFELTEERDAYSKINIKPEPDSLLRVAIHIKKVDSYTKIKEQKLPTFKRNGFTVVEWGGVTY